MSESRVWAGRSDQVKLGLSEQALLTIPRGSEKSIKASMLIDEIIKAPIKVGDELGQLEVRLQDELLLKRPLVALNAVEEAGLLARLWDSIKLFFIGLFDVK